MKSLFKNGWLLLFPLLILACNQNQALPTMMPTAVAITLSPTDTPNLPPTQEINLPTPTQAPSATPVLPTAEPSPVVGPSVNVTTPSEGAAFLLGNEITASGFAQLDPTDSLVISLVSATGHKLSESTAQVQDFNNWQATLQSPHFVSGPAEIQAIIYDQTGSIRAADAQTIDLVVNREGTDRFLELYRPISEENPVAGYNLFFDGWAQFPVNNLITISIWNESCQTEVARQNFILGGSGYWQGFIVVPRNVTGPVCAVANFGTPGEESWRESHVTLNVLPADDPDAIGVHIGNPPPNSRLTPDESLLFYGTAHNAPDNMVLISVLMENGRLLTEGVAPVDDYGYWEVRLFIPADASGPTQIEVTVGDPDSDIYAQHQIMVNIGVPEQ